MEHSPFESPLHRNASNLSEAKLAAAYDVVIVGSGHNALVAAAYLSKAGKSVLILEKNTTIGGATASQKVFPEYDAWLSRYSYLVSLFPNQIIEDLGLTFQTLRRKTASFTPYKVQNTHKGLVLSNEDPKQNENALNEMAGPDAWNKYQKLMALEQAIAELVWPTMLQPLKPKSYFESRLQTDLQKEAWNSFVEEPLGNVIERYADHDDLRGLLMTDGKIGVFTHPHDPSLLQNRCFLYHVVGGGTGEWRVPKGGMQALVASLFQVCLQNNVNFLTSAEVLHVETGTPRHTLTFRDQNSNERSVQCEFLLVNAGPSTYAKLFGLPYTKKPSDEGSVVKINMLLKRLPKLKAEGIRPEVAFAGSFHFSEGYQQMIQSYQAASKGEIPNPVPGEIYCHTLTDPSILSPELQAKGFQTLTLFGLDMPYRLFSENHDSKKQQVLNLYLDGLDQVLAEPIRECLAENSDGSLCVEIKTPQELEKEVGLDYGNIFHSELSWFYSEQYQENPWGVNTDFPNVFFAGSSAVRGGAVSGIPGYCAAQQVLNSR
jgi:phytoene dehydrogenase-like protein